MSQTNNIYVDISGDSITSSTPQKILNWLSVQPTGLLDTSAIHLGKTIEIFKASTLISNELGSNLDASFGNVDISGNLTVTGEIIEPTLTRPKLGTPESGDLSNCTLPIARNDVLGGVKSGGQNITIDTSGVISTTNILTASNLTVDGNTTLGSIIPLTNNAHDLGSSDLKFKNIYLSGSLYGNITGNAATVTNGAQTAISSINNYNSNNEFENQITPLFENEEYTFGVNNYNFIDRTASSGNKILTAKCSIIPNTNAQEGVNNTTSHYNSINSIFGSSTTYSGGYSKVGCDLGSLDKQWFNVYALIGSLQQIHADTPPIVKQDKLYMNDICDCDLGLEFINNLKPISYKCSDTYNNILSTDISHIQNPGIRRHYGFTGQQVKETLGDKDFAGYCCDSSTNICSLRLEEFISPSIKAIQELNTKCITQEFTINELKSDNATIKTALNILLVSLGKNPI